MSSPSADRLTPQIASQFARIALGHVAREYPTKMDHVLTGPEDIRAQIPTALPLLLANMVLMYVLAFR